ncbi:MAG: hypothetical protein FWF84_01460 [Kiritimatiellaeota bacterium]|nr:hypothetical protein [Kiritimatiellota bacterium]
MLPNQCGKGGSTTLFGGYSELSADDIVPRVNLGGTGWFAGITESFNLVDTQDSLLLASVGVTYRYLDDQFSVDVDNHGSYESLQKRNISILPLTVSLSYSDRTGDALGGRNFVTLSGVYNLNAGGSNEYEDFWVGAKKNYVLARLQLARVQPLNLFGDYDTRGEPVRQWTLFAKAEGQYTPDPLIPAEKLFLGGFNGGIHSVRGYRAKSRLGDNGVYGTLEFRTPIMMDRLASLFGAADGTRKMPADRLQLHAFVDAGYVEAIDPLPGVTGSAKMLGVGAGARLAVTKHTQFRFDAGFPLHDKKRDDDTPIYYFSAQAQF